MLCTKVVSALEGLMGKPADMLSLPISGLRESQVNQWDVM